MRLMLSIAKHHLSFIFSLFISLEQNYFVVPVALFKPGVPILFVRRILLNIEQPSTHHYVLQYYTVLHNSREIPIISYHIIY